MIRVSAKLCGDEFLMETDDDKLLWSGYYAWLDAVRLRHGLVPSAQSQPEAEQKESPDATP